jgi:glutathione S-transferase
MKAMITLHQLDESPFCDKVRRALHWKRIPYRIHELSMLQVLTRLGRVNPIRKVPALELDGRVVADSTDIAYFLDQQWPERPLLPRDPAERALCHFLEDWADESLYYYELRLRFTFPKNRPRWIAALLAHDAPSLRPLFSPVISRTIRKQCAAQGIGRKPDEMVLRDLDRQMDALAAWLAGKSWLVGSGLTLADIAVYAQLRCIDGTEEGHARLSARPMIQEWMSRVADATAKPVEAGASAPREGSQSATG